MVDEDSRGSGPATNRLSSAVRLIVAIRLAFDLRKLVIAAMGIVFLQFGSSILDGMFGTSIGVAPNTFDAGIPIGTMTLSATQAGIWQQLTTLHSGISEPIRVLTTPLFAMIDPGAGRTRMPHALLRLLWVLSIWGICGGAIARIAVVQVAQIRQTGIGEALRFSFKSLGSLILAPLCPTLGLVCCATFLASFGLLYRVPEVGATIAGMVLFIPLVVGVLMSLMVAGLVAGWPLMVAAVASGAQDALDAWSRTFGYLTQRIGPFVSLLALSWIEGIVGLILVELFAGGVIRLTSWGLGLTAGDDQVAVLFGHSTGSGAIAGGAHRFWLGSVGILAKSWIYSYFWSGAALVYLWLRHDVDGTPWSECDRPAAPTP